mmetsp:Transcript_34667/g.70767  ORF Transcript_34667/g.70767 Transcript_34667/m.70767 type:complete len:113 (+) Transcript_34667:358-696(+)
MRKVPFPDGRTPSSFPPPPPPAERAVGRRRPRDTPTADLDTARAGREGDDDETDGGRNAETAIGTDDAEDRRAAVARAEAIAPRGRAVGFGCGRLAMATGRGRRAQALGGAL